MTFSANGQVAVARKKVGSGATALYSLHTDQLGNVAAVANSAGVYVTDSYAMYEPFGAFLLRPTATNPSVSDRGFTGHQQNNTGTYDFGLIYMNARYYQPQLGRFVSPDTIVPEPGEPQSFNRYAYVRNSPMNFMDPTGHREISGCNLLDCTRGGTVNPMTYRSADGTYSFADPHLVAQYPSPTGKKLTAIATADAYGAGVTASFSLDTPIAGIEVIAGREAIYVHESDTTTEFFVIGGGIRIGPSKSFVSSLKKLVDGVMPVNMTISPYVSAVSNVDNAVEDYSGVFRYKATTVAYELGATATETNVPGSINRQTASSMSIGPAFGYGLTASEGVGYAIPFRTRQPGQIFPTYHNPVPYIKDLASRILSEITGIR